ncbi:MAG TPA: ISKra4 family transposase [Chloroflexota bacterium]|nr:ISKra4 family transposase [Chloroflexota bacterium]
MDDNERAAGLAAEVAAGLADGLAEAWETLTSADLGRIEGCLQGVLRVVGGALVAGLARRRLAVLAGTRARCPRCGGAARLVNGARPRVLVGLVGEVRLRRPWYQCAACRQGYAPLDEAWGLGRGAVTPGLARVACRDGLEAPFGQGADLLAENLGVRLHEDTVRRLTESVGQVVEHDQADWTRWTLPPGEGVPPILAVELDGVLLHERQRWIETKIGRVAALGPGLVVDRETGEAHLALGPSAYCVAVGSVDAFWPRLAREVARAGLGRGVRTVVVLADGADWIWAQARAQFHSPGVEVVEIVDFYHACEHLGTVATAVHGPGSLWASDWLDRQCHALRHEGVTPIQEALAALEPRTAEAADEVRRARGYFATHAARMAYPAFRARLFPIGSGAIESTAKNLIQQRQTLAGMRWTRDGAQQVASLRALQRSGRWTAFWQTQPLRRLRLLVSDPARTTPSSTRDRARTTPTLPPPSAPPGRTHIETTGKPWAKGKDAWRRAPMCPKRSA